MHIRPNLTCENALVRLRLCAVLALEDHGAVGLRTVSDAAVELDGLAIWR